ncbi:MAG: MFS transporter [Chloroflexi bacterium]|nr:MFS transporter [Chloroflexota bacterium]MDA1228459.1 MFS transporter [Chloroflexota bacterium]
MNPPDVADEGESQPAPRRRRRLPRLQTFDSLSAYPDYRLLFIGNFCANSAQWLQLLSIGWLVRSLTVGSSSSALLVVTVGGLNTLPGLFFGPIAGVIGDRVDRRKLVIRLQIFMAIFAMFFAFMVGARMVTVWHAYIYVLVSGICITITQPMRQAMIANVVPRESLGNAYATNVITIPGTRMIGPFIGGILIATLGFFWNFTMESLLYAANVLVLIRMKMPYYTPRKIAQGQSILVDLIEGFMYIWRDNRVIIYLTALSLLPNTLLQPLMFLLPVFTDEVLRRGPEVGGFFLAINGFGGMMMALLTASFGFVFPKGKIVLVTAIISSGLVLLFSHAVILPLAFFLIMLYAASQTLFRTTNGTLIQLLVPDEMRGRVTTLQRYSMGFVVVSSMLIGWLAGVFSVSIVLAVMGIIGMFAGTAAYMVSHRIRELE